MGKFFLLFRFYKKTILFGIQVAVILSSTPIQANSCSQKMHIIESYIQALAIVEKSHRQAAPRLVQNLSPGTDKIRLIYEGPPNDVKLVKEPEKLVLCHYRSEARIQQIKKTSTIIAGPVPYVYSHSPYEKITYKDLTGIFLTTPERSPASVGMADPHKVYLKLPKGVGLLELEPGILMIPGKPLELEIPVTLVDHP